jgi:sortase A
VYTVIGIVLLGLAGILMFIQYLPILQVELQYRLQGISGSREGQSEALEASLQPLDTQFGILIPKIRANASVVPNVDPFDSRIYQEALSRGVAHAKGSALPDTVGNVFIFSHSSANFWEATRFNSVFYLLSKLEYSDQIVLYYQDIKYTYRVTDKQIVLPTAVSYLSSISRTPMLTLMTCWPPGTNTKRLIVTATLIN